MKEGWNVILRYDDAFAGVNLWLVKQCRDGSKVVVNPIDITQTSTLEPTMIPPEPTIRFHGHEAQQFLQGLSDGLVEAGFTPDAIKASDKQVEAIKAHLEDMRGLVFKNRK